MSDAGSCAVDPRMQNYKPETRTFYTYLPRWMPKKPRRWFLKQPDLYPTAGHTAKLMLGLPIMSDSLDDIKRRQLAYLLVAYARDGGKYAFEVSDRVWQEECARKLCEVLENAVSRGMQAFSYPRSSIGISLVGMQPSTRRLQFRWMAIDVTTDIRMLYDVIKRQAYAAGQFYERRWQDRRYGCITESRCPVPTDWLKFRRASDMELGMAFDYVVRAWVSQYVIQQASPFNLRHLLYLSSISETSMPCTFLLSKPIRDLWNNNDARLVAIENKAREEALKTYPWQTHDDALLLCTGWQLSATIIAEIDQLVEEAANETHST